MKRLLVILGVLFVAGVAIAGVLYVTFPVQMTTYGGMGLNFLKSLFAPAGTLTIETNPAYKAPVAAVPSPPLADAAWPNAAVGDWPSYNRTPTSQRFSPLDQINAKNVGNLKVLCTYDLGVFTAFESGLIMVNNALIGTTEFEIFSINPATCAENWRTRLDYPGALLPANRGAAYMDGLLFRGTQDCRVLAFDFKTGKQVWETTICDPKRGESVPSAPIAWDGLVFVGNAGGDYKGGKGKVYALEGKTGKIVWQFFLVPQVEGDVVRGPLGKSPLDAIDLEQRARHTHQRRRDLDLVHARHQERFAVRPGRQSGPRLRLGSTRRRESLHRLGRGTRRQDGRLQEQLQGREEGLA